MKMSFGVIIPFDSNPLKILPHLAQSCVFTRAPFLSTFLSYFKLMYHWTEQSIQPYLCDMYAKFDDFHKQLNAITYH